jgi:hypothetical protein
MIVTNPNPKFNRTLVAMMREHLRLQADVRSLASILIYAETENHLPTEGWLATLKGLRQTPEYRSISEQYEPLFLSAEQAADLAECQQLLATMPKSEFPN